MKQSLLKSLIGKVAVTSSALPALRNARVTEGKNVTITDLDNTLLVNLDDQQSDFDGLVDLALLKKTCDIGLSVVDPEKTPTTDFPLLPTDMLAAAIGSNKVVKVPVDPFNLQLADFLNFVSNDVTRAVLCGVYFSAEDKAIAATTGHVMLEEKVEGLTESFVLGSKAITIMVALLKAKLVIERVCLFDKVKDGEYRYIAFLGKDFTLVSKLLEGPYPDYSKCLPKLKKGSVLTAPWQAYMIDGLKTLDPAVPPKTKLFRLSREHMRAHYETTSWQIPAPACLMAELPKEVDAVGYNAKLYQMVLSTMKGENLIVRMSPTTIGATIMEQGERRGLIMPLRIIQDPEDATRVYKDLPSPTAPGSEEKAEEEEAPAGGDEPIVPLFSNDDPGTEEATEEVTEDAPPPEAETPSSTTASTAPESTTTAPGSTVAFGKNYPPSFVKFNPPYRYLLRYEIEETNGAEYRKYQQHTIIDIVGEKPVNLEKDYVAFRFEEIKLYGESPALHFILEQGLRKLHVLGCERITENSYVKLVKMGLA